MNTRRTLWAALAGLVTVGTHATNPGLYRKMPGARRPELAKRSDAQVD